MKKIIGIIITILFFSLMVGCNNSGLNEILFDKALSTTSYEVDEENSTIDIVVPFYAKTYYIYDLLFQNDDVTLKVKDESGKDIEYYMTLCGQKETYTLDVSAYNGNKELTKSYTLTLEPEDVITDMEFSIKPTSFIVGAPALEGNLNLISSKGDKYLVTIDECVVDGYDSSLLGDNVMNVTYGYFTKELPYEIVEDYVVDFKFPSDDEILKYYNVGDNFNSIPIKLIYASGKEEWFNIDEDDVKGFSTDTVANERKIDIIYDGEVIYSYTIEVKDHTIIDIDLTDIKRHYEIGEAFQGGKVKVTFADGCKETYTITQDMADFTNYTSPTRINEYFYFTVEDKYKIYFKIEFVIGHSEDWFDVTTYTDKSLNYNITNEKDLIEAFKELVCRISYNSQNDKYEKKYYIFEDYQKLHTFLNECKITIVSNDDEKVRFRLEINETDWTEVDVRKSFDPLKFENKIKIDTFLDDFYQENTICSLEDVYNNLFITMQEEDYLSNHINRVLSTEEKYNYLKNLDVDFEIKNNRISIVIKKDNTILFDDTMNIKLKSDLSVKDVKIEENSSYYKINYDKDGNKLLNDSFIYKNNNYSKMDEYILNNVIRKFELYFDNVTGRSSAYIKQIDGNYQEFLDKYVTIYETSYGYQLKVKIKNFEKVFDFYENDNSLDKIIHIGIYNIDNDTILHESTLKEDLIKAIEKGEISVVYSNEYGFSYFVENIEEFINSCKLTYYYDLDIGYMYFTLTKDFAEYTISFKTILADYSSYVEDLKWYISSSKVVYQDVNKIGEAILNQGYLQYNTGNGYSSVNDYIEEVIKQEIKIKVSEIDENNMVTYKMYYKDILMQEGKIEVISEYEANTPVDFVMMFSNWQGYNVNNDEAIFVIQEGKTINDFFYDCPSSWYYQTPIKIIYIDTNDENYESFVNNHFKLTNLNDNKYEFTFSFNDYIKTTIIYFENYDSKEVLDLNYEFRNLLGDDIVIDDFADFIVDNIISNVSCKTVTSNYEYVQISNLEVRDIFKSATNVDYELDGNKIIIKFDFKYFQKQFYITILGDITINV